MDKAVAGGCISPDRDAISSSSSMTMVMVVVVSSPFDARIDVVAAAAVTAAVATVDCSSPRSESPIVASLVASITPP